jgi:RNA polymerase sigma-70 factor (ECF subfamily)
MTVRPSAPASDRASAATPVEAEVPFSPEATIDLLTKVKAGDQDALNRLVTRCLPSLTRWAHGRLRGDFRDIQDTVDLVQDTIVAALKRLGQFEPRHEGSLQAYLRVALDNRVRDVIRRQGRRPVQTALPDDLEAADLSPLAQAIGRENRGRYEAALARLRPSDRELVIARLELHYGYEDLAVAFGKATVNAARVAVGRAVHRLAEEIRRQR